MEHHDTHQLLFTKIITTHSPRQISLQAESSDKHIWLSESINENLAKQFSNNDYNLGAIEEIIRIITEPNSKLPDVKADVTFVKEDLLVIITVTERWGERHITIPLEKQARSDIVRLEQQLAESKAELRNLQEQLDAIQSERDQERKQKRLLVNYTDFVDCFQSKEDGPTKSIEVCCVKIPPGKWLVEYSFEFSTGCEKSIPFYFCCKQKNSVIHTLKGPLQGATLGGRKIIETVDEDEVYLKFCSVGRYVPRGDFRVEDVIITAKPVESK